MLEALGVNLEVTPEQVDEAMEILDKALKVGDAEAVSTIDDAVAFAEASPLATGVIA